MTGETRKYALERIMSVMAKLRDPENGCPWDRKQTWETLIKHTLEEAYEVADAIEQRPSHEPGDVQSELGDLLFQVVFYSRVAEEQGWFDLHDVIYSLCDKLERRHPHVFGDLNFETREQLEESWHASKAEERQQKAMHSVLDDIPLSLPALTRSQKLQRRAANEGFDWPDHQGVLNKLDEELAEFNQALSSGEQSAIEDELGDLFFTLVNLSRHLNADSETLLRRANQKFERRYRQMESGLIELHKKPSDFTIEELEALWQEAKRKV